MNWFDEQLRTRAESDNAEFADALESIANAVMGKRLRDALDSTEIADSAIEEILKYYHCKTKNAGIPAKVGSLEEHIEYVMRPFGIRSRRVLLEDNWYANAAGAMLGTLTEDGTAVVLLPGKISGYMLVDVVSGKKTRIRRNNAGLIDSEAVCFYPPLPQRPLKIRDLLVFMAQQLNFSDIALYLALMVISSLLGLLSPLFTKWLFGDVLKSGSVQVLAALAVFMVCYSISSLCFSAFQSLISSRIETKQNIAVQAAVMNRIMSLPPTFFRQFAAGELAQRSAYVQSLCSTLFSSIGMTGLTSLFSLIYIAQIFAFAPGLVVPALSITLATVVFSLITVFAQMSITRKKMDESARTGGMTYSTIAGVQKIRLAGAEKRAFSRWAKQYAKEASLEYDKPLFLRLSGTISLALTLIGTLILYAAAIKSNVSVADYYAFTTAYSMVSSAFMAIVPLTETIASIKPVLEMAKPILDAEPETQERKENIEKLRGEIELSHVSFRYDESSPNVIDDLSLHIAPGEYLAITGSTGCGKSTLMRLLLGFEKPQKGTISYDKKDISRIDPESLRKKIGVVMQDSRLFPGDIMSNIMITAPELGVDRAWEAAEIASVADDIRAMPMMMNTMISEGQGGVSGGQKQRLIIARAVASGPKILMFDEATSALDNITQRKVSEAIDKLKCTRIVIAHRLSTIQHAGRIIYLENGKIKEQGTYEELLALNGSFAKLVERQQL